MHVPLMVFSPAEAFMYNVFGSYNVARSADQIRVKRMVTAVHRQGRNPPNVMGPPSARPR